MRVAVVAEYYPRRAEPELGIWAHRQVLAARDAGADVRVLVLHRPIPPREAFRRRDRHALLAPVRQPLRARLDGIAVWYVPFVAPPRPRSYGGWGRWAAPPLALALRVLRLDFPFDLVHAHYAAPSGNAVRLARAGVPTVVSAHGGDVFATVAGSRAGAHAVTAGLQAASLVIANSQGVAARCRGLGARRIRVVHPGTDVPDEAPPAPREQRLVTVANLVARKRHAEVARALALLAAELTSLRWLVIGEGPERGPLEGLVRSLGLADRVDFAGHLRHDAAVAEARASSIFVLPSIDEAFGVAYVEAMAGGVPAIGACGEPGPEDIAALGGGMSLVPASDPQALADEIRRLLEPEAWARASANAAETAARHFSWEHCGRETVAAYEEALS
jgi:glycosyltransferase involved in cell wall biosynthesis